VASQYLTVPTGGELLFVDMASGKRLLEWDPGRGVTAPATANNGSLYVLSNAGVLYALEVLGGR
jgi:outer membrane protein assembly factor BamB